MIIKPCLNCNDIISLYPSKAERKFCSHECYGKWKSENWIPWNKGLIFKNSIENKGVPPNWRRKILERDNYICQKCGYKENLHIHHKIEFKIIKKHTLDNLITLCEKCHYKEHNWKFAGKGPDQV